MMNKLNTSIISVAAAMAFSMPAQSVNIDQMGDSNWYQFVFGKDLSGSMAASGEAPTFAGFDDQRRNWGVDINAQAEVTLGCQGIDFDDSFTTQIEHYLDDLFRAFDNPMAVAIASGSYFLGSAFVVAGELQAQINENFTWMAASCESAGQLVANMTVEAIPELAKYQCRDEYSGAERECIGDQLAQKVNETLEEMHSQASTSLNDWLNEKFSQNAQQPQDTRTHIKGEVATYNCRASSQVGYLMSVYAVTSMQCQDFLDLKRVIGEVILMPSSSSAATGDPSDLYRYVPGPISIRELFVEYSMAYGQALYAIARDDDWENSIEYERLQKAPGASQLTPQQLNVLKTLERTGRELELASRIRQVSDLWALNHIDLMISESLSAFARYEERPDVKFRLEDNILKDSLIATKNDLDSLLRLIEMRQRESEAWRGGVEHTNG